MVVTIDGGKITSVSPRDRSSVIIDGAELLLSDNAVLLPGFVDTHCHLIGLGQMAERVQLGGLNTITDCVSRVALRALSTPPGEWILGFGWNETEWLDHAKPHRSALDAATPDHPVALYRVDTHMVWLNSRALAESNIVPHEIDGGEIVVDADGSATGLLIDNAVHLIDSALPVPSNERMRRWIAIGVDQCLSYGITEVHDMNVSLAAVDAAMTASIGGELRIRSNVFLDGMSNEWREFGAPRSLTPMVEIVGVKYFADGALGSRGAWLLEPYSDAPTSGLQLIERGDLVERASEAASVGHAIATHAIGDAANRLVLDAYESLRARHPEALLRIEHAQIVNPADVPRFASMDVIAAMQPTHCTSDASMAEARLGPERCAHAYAWRTLLSNGARIIAGSDFPIESPDPLAGIRAFVRRETRGGVAWRSEEAIDREPAISAFTEWAPQGGPRRARRGRLEVGYEADIVVLTGDPLDADTAVLYTIVGGRVEYEGM